MTIESVEEFTTRLCAFVYDQVPGSTGMGYLIEPLIRARDEALLTAVAEAINRLNYATPYGVAAAMRAVDDVRFQLYAAQESEKADG